MPIFRIINSGMIDLDSHKSDQLYLRRIYIEKFKNSGSSAMNVDGSSTPVEFKLGVDSSKYKEIVKIKFIIHGEKMAIRTNEGQDFSKDHSNGLSNGIKFFYKYGSDQINLFLDSVKKLSDFYLYSESIVCDVKAVDNQTDLLMTEFDLVEPIRLITGTNDEIVIKIQDDLSDLSRFEAIAFGSVEIND